MPELPELRLAAQFVSRVCKPFVFKAPLLKSAVSKNAEVQAPYQRFTVSGQSRGKEMLLLLADATQKSGTSKKTKSLNPSHSGDPFKVVFRFGMSGNFFFGTPTDLPKHAHLMIYSEDGTHVLAFCDPRRFGSWEAADFDLTERGPDPTISASEFEAFRRNILINLSKSVFDKPICEVLLEQQFFNGIGNYLRAEILHRAGVAPFVKARDALLPCFTDEELASHSLQAPTSSGKRRVISNLLSLCQDVPLEVVSMGLSYFAPDQNDESDDGKFEKWLRVYQKGQNLVDSKGRTIWFFGAPGPLAPKAKKVRRATLKTTNEVESEPAQASTHSQDKKSAEKSATEPAAPYILLSSKKKKVPVTADSKSVVVTRPLISTKSTKKRGADRTSEPAAVKSKRAKPAK